MNINDGGRRRFEDNEYILRIYFGIILEGIIYCLIFVRKNFIVVEVIEFFINRFNFDKIKCYVLVEVKEFGGEEWIFNLIDCLV